jgi:hypothetical protein
MQDLDQNWEKVKEVLKTRFGKDSDVKSVLFIIGLRELGKNKKKFTKEEKQDLMNLAVCKILSPEGYFEVSHLDGDGWPVWKQAKPLPTMNNKEQENFIKEHIIMYFADEGLLS